MDITKKLLTSKEAAAYLGLDYSNFRKSRNIGYFGRGRYPAPAFVNVGDTEQGIRYRVSDLDTWLENFPTFATPHEFYQAMQEQEMKALKSAKQSQEANTNAES